MSWLYIDTTDHLIYGLLSSQFEWLEYVDGPSKKNSNLLHYLIHEMLQARSITIKSLDGLIFAAGPGSYTGMRVAEGMAQVFEWEKKRVYSFYHFQVPQFLQVEDGVWFSKAFKAENYLYQWSSLNKTCSNSSYMSQDILEALLIPEEEFVLYLDKIGFKKIYTNFFLPDFENLKELGYELILTSDEIKQHASLVFMEVIKKNLRSPPLYYRSEDKEFKKAK